MRFLSKNCKLRAEQCAPTCYQCGKIQHAQAFRNPVFTAEVTIIPGAMGSPIEPGSCDSPLYDPVFTGDPT